MAKAQVAIAKNADPVEMAASVLELAGIGELCRGKEVLIKANLSGGPYEKKGAIVNEETTRGVLTYLKPFCKRLVLGDAAGFSVARTKELLEEKTFAKRLADELGIELANLWDCEHATVKVPKPIARSEWTIPQSILDFEMVGSLSVMKVSAITTATLCLKNFYGLLAVKKMYRMHPWAHEMLVDFAQIVKPAFGIIDGFWGWEAHEASLGGRGINANMVLAGKDIIAVDAIGAMVMGRDPKGIKKLRIAQEIGLGISNPEEIEILGTPIEKARIVFEDVPEGTWPVPKQSTLDAGIEALLVGA